MNDMSAEPGTAIACVSLKCPGCAGPLEIPEGDTVAKCPHCGSYALFLGETGVRKYILPTGLDSTDVLRQCRETMSSRNVSRNALGEASVRKPQLFYVPFWHLDVQVHGYVVGVEPIFVEEEISTVPEDDSGRSSWVFAPRKTVKHRTGGRAVEKEIHVGSTINVSAADLEPLGIPSLSSETQLAMRGLEIQSSGLPDGLEVLDSSNLYDGVFVDPTIQVNEAIAQAERYAGRLAGGSGRGLEKKWEYSVLAGRRCSLIYYPIWVVAFLHRGRSYQLVVDGRSGSVIRGRMPGRSHDRTILTCAAAAFWSAAIPLSIDLGLLMTSPNWRRGSAPETCIGVLLALVIGAGVLTYRFLDALQELGRASSDEYRI